MIFLMYLILGLLAGVIAGLLGLGGGIVIVPGLLAIFNLQHFPENHLMHMATATSLASISITTPMVVLLQHQRQRLQWSTLRWLIPTTMCGALLGVWTSKFLSTHLLKIGFGLFLFGMGLNILLKPEYLSFSKSPKPFWLSFIFSLFVGILSGLLGIGGGILLIPLLLWMGFGMTQTSTIL